MKSLLLRSTTGYLIATKQRSGATDNPKHALGLVPRFRLYAWFATISLESKQWRGAGGSDYSFRSASHSCMLPEPVSSTHYPISATFFWLWSSKWTSDMQGLKMVPWSVKKKISMKNKCLLKATTVPICIIPVVWWKSGLGFQIKVSHNCSQQPWCCLRLVFSWELAFMIQIHIRDPNQCQHYLRKIIRQRPSLGLLFWNRIYSTVAYDFS